MINTRRKKLLAEFMDEVWNKGIFNHLDKFVTPRYSVGNDANDPWSGQTIDHEVFIERVLYSRDAFPDLNFDIKEMVEEGDVIAIRWIMSGTHLGNLPQLPATGRKFSITGMTFYSFDEDLINGHTQSFDQLGFLAQIGAFGK